MEFMCPKEASHCFDRKTKMQNWLKHWEDYLKDNLKVSEIITSKDKP